MSWRLSVSPWPCVSLEPQQQAFIRFTGLKCIDLAKKKKKKVAKNLHDLGC